MIPTLAAVATGVILWAWSGASSGVGSQPPVTGVKVDQAGVLAKAAAQSARERRAVDAAVGSQQSVEPNSDREADSSNRDRLGDFDAPKGSLYGALFGVQGEEMCRHRLLFSPEERNLPAVTVLTDARGRFESGPLAAGWWKIRYLGPGDQPATSGGTVLAIAEVVADHSLPFDLMLAGERRLTGSLKMPEIDGLALRLELIPWGQVDAVATAVAVTHNPKAVAEDTERSDAPKHPDPPSGAFRMEGLEAGRYRLRILFDTEGRIALEMEVDLSADDVKIDRSFRLEDFLGS